MTRSFSTTPLRARVRSGLAVFNGLPWATALEQWNLSSADVVFTADSGSPGAPGAYSPQSPAAAVVAAAALAWSAINTYDTLTGWGPTYGGFPQPAQIQGNYTGGAVTLTQCYPVANGTFTYMGNWGGQQLIFADQTGSGAEMFDTTGLVAWPPPSIGYGIYRMPNGAPGQPGSVGSIQGQGPLSTTLMSNWCFAPLYMGAVPYGASGYLWANCQFAGRTRYRLQHPYPSLCGLRLNCELWAQNVATGLWAPSAADWSNYPLTSAGWGLPPVVVLVITCRNFSFNSVLSDLPSTATGASAGAGGWTEIPLPAVPSGWTAPANALTGFMGLATMDFWGYRTRAQWETATGLAITG